jgi:16S rRNA (guanine966-N2)-methyltransferase
MKIIKGIYKNRIINCASGTRPVSVQVRKACFDILGDELKDKTVLDLFAGSGALGLEALSAGAKSVVFVDNNKAALDAISKTYSDFKIGTPLVLLRDALLIIPDFCNNHKGFDIIFIDPPYSQSLLIKILKLLEEYDIVAPLGFLVCFAFQKDEALAVSKRFNLILSRKYGQTKVLIYQKK